MIKLGDFAINMGGFVDLGQLILTETAKYLLLFLFAVLAIRLWRRLPKLSGANRRNNFLLAGLSTICAAAIGYFSICHSMGRLYLHYGMRAFQSNYLLPALSLFAKSGGYWRGADAVGDEGVCLLWLDKTDVGAQLLDEAKAMRHGKNSSFENFYAGTYYFFHDQPDKSIPFLEAASTDEAYHWSVVKIFAMIQLDQNQPQEAGKLMQPFLQVPVTETDQAYVMASLDLAAGKKDDALALWQKFSTDDLSPYWKSRFDKLGVKIQNQNR